MGATAAVTSATAERATRARIAIAGLAKSYGDLQVFRDIDLALGEREIVTVVGPSGCGKTTLLRCISGLIVPSAGTVSIDGTLVDAPLPGTALVGAVLAEIFASIDGLGMFILANARALQQNEAVVGVLMLAAFGIGFDLLTNATLRRWFPWYRRSDMPEGRAG